MQTPLITLTPPANLKAPKPNLYDAYNQLMVGDTATARATMAQFYNEGAKNPRARMYETSIELKNMLGLGSDVTHKLPAHLKEEFKQQHNSVMNEIMNSNHSMVKNAKNNLLANFKKIYPAEKTQAFTMFIIEKTIVPKMSLFKRFAGLLGKML